MSVKKILNMLAAGLTRPGHHFLPQLNQSRECAYGTVDSDNAFSSAPSAFFFFVKWTKYFSKQSNMRNIQKVKILMIEDKKLIIAWSEKISFKKKN